MKLEPEFIQLPLQFDMARLAYEVLALPDSAWTPDEQGAQGLSSLPLVSPGGGQNNQLLGVMRYSKTLHQCPYIQQVLASFRSVIGHTRLVRLEPGCKVVQHFEVNPSWLNKVRIHIPIHTHRQVVFSSHSNVDAHLQAGDAWVLDSWRPNSMYNRSDTSSVHLEIDTVGSSDFFRLVAQGQDPCKPKPDWSALIKKVAYEEDKTVEAPCEKFNQTTVYTPDQITLMLREFLGYLNAWRLTAPKRYVEFTSTVEAFLQDWRAQWSLYANTKTGLPHYFSLQSQLKVSSKRLLSDALLDSNQAKAIDILSRWLDSTIDTKVVARVSAENSLSRVRTRLDISLFDSPIFIVAAPRSGSTLLFESLQQNLELWTLGDESHQVFESINALHPATKQFESNALTAEDYNEEIGASLVGGFMRRLRNSSGTLFSQISPETQGSNLRFLEKTPKNALRIPFLRELFPNAMFIYLHRQAEANIGSIIDAWNSGKFVTYPNLPEWSGPPWSLLLPPEWRRFNGRPIAEIAAWQWAQTNQKIVYDLCELPKKRWHLIDYQDFLDNREGSLQEICHFADIPFGPKMQALARQVLPNSKYTLSPPMADKWKQHQQEIESAIANIPEVERVRHLINGLCRNDKA